MRRSLPPSSSLTRAALAVPGWGGLLAMLLLAQPLGALAPFGPGLALLDSLRIRVFADYRALLDTAALCSLAAGAWPPSVFAKITGMWMAMLMAMFTLGLMNVAALVALGPVLRGASGVLALPLGPQGRARRAASADAGAR